MTFTGRLIKGIYVLMAPSKTANMQVGVNSFKLSDLFGEINTGPGSAGDYRINVTAVFGDCSWSDEVSY